MLGFVLNKSFLMGGDEVCKVVKNMFGKYIKKICLGIFKQ